MTLLTIDIIRAIHSSTGEEKLALKIQRLGSRAESGMKQQRQSLFLLCGVHPSIRARAVGVVAQFQSSHFRSNCAAY